ncbi:Hemolysin-type calcium-binding repeat-containing protein [Nonomuraea solani]|uniref:Hemolysin-type calcium-binding repeat-containing protein n=1 Tax=Nonomuraea solani TaxID=1144553 RepID=A0A1H6DT12_9ACTN|nr:hypothetical protein [Nonomuraea solani]SEG87883.1 Hemolysin-type calcium-binding repeat-containing protein [Nonomuraea solani]
MRKLVTIAGLVVTMAGLQAAFALPSHADTLVSATLGNLNVSAAPGKANNITIDATPFGAVVISDSADIVRISGGGCVQLTPNSVECNGIFLVRVFAGDLNDNVLNNTSVSTHMHGDAGVDTLKGGGGTDQFFPGVGNDILFGNGGNDIFNADLVADGADDFSGGPGVDVAAYNNRGAGLTITLNDVANDGASTGEGDNMRADVENVFAGSGSDTVTGNGRPNEIRAGQGSDVLNGLGGADDLSAVDGVGGNDTLNGGAGSDICRSDAGDSETLCELN